MLHKIFRKNILYLVIIELTIRIRHLCYIIYLFITIYNINSLPEVPHVSERNPCIIWLMLLAQNRNHDLDWRRDLILIQVPIYHHTQQHWINHHMPILVGCDVCAVACGTAVGYKKPTEKRAKSLLLMGFWLAALHAAVHCSHASSSCCFLFWLLCRSRGIFVYTRHSVEGDAICRQITKSWFMQM